MGSRKLFDNKSQPEDILKYFPELQNSQIGNYGVTALQIATAFTKQGVTPLIRKLASDGSNINVQDQLGRSPLHYSVINDNVELVKFLLSSGANPNLKLQYNPSVKEVSIDERWSKLYTILPPPDTTDSWKGRTALHIATKRGYVEITKVLINNGANVNAEDDKKVTPLLLVGSCRNTIKFEEMTKALVEAGADVNRICYVTGTSALFHAVLLESPKSCDLLLKAGAWLTNFGRKETELHKAAANGLYEILEKFLIDPRITIDDVNRPDECHRTPVYKAALGGHKECLKLLIDNGGNLGTRTAKVHDTILDAIFSNVNRPADFFTDLLDSRIKSNNLKPNDEHYRITLDFALLAPRGSNHQMKVITNLIFAAREQERFVIMQHPLIESFLRIKWAHIRQFFFLLVTIYVLFVASLSVYVAMLINWKSVKNSIAADVARYFLMVTSAGLLGHGIIQCVLLPRHFIHQYELWTYISSEILALSLSIGLDLNTPENTDVPDWIYHVASFAILLAWMELMLLIGRLPTYGHYALMFSVVLQNAIKVLLTFTCLVIGFAFSFSVQFHEEYMFAHPWRSLVKTTVMMMGEYEYGDLMKERESGHPGYIIFLGFIVLASIVLMNLMVGLAVKDIQILQQEGHVRRLEKQAEFIRQLEMVISLKILDKIWLPKFIRTFIRKKRSIHTTLNIQPQFSHSNFKTGRWHKNLPTELVDQIKEIASRNDGNEEDDRVRTSQDMERLIATLRQIIHSCEGRRGSVISSLRV